MFDIGYFCAWPDLDVEVHWSRQVPDGMTALLLDEGHLAASPFEQVERIGGWERIIAWAQARQYAEIAAFARAAEDTPAEGLGPTEAVESAQAEIGLMLRLSAGGVAWRVSEARSLVDGFPDTFAALADGAITLVKARIIAEGGADLSDAHAARVEARVLPKAPQQTNGQLRAAVRRAVLTEDPEAAERRQRRRRRERRVVLYPERDGMATLSATMPAAEAVGVYAVLDQHARACGSTDDRTMDARRTDTLVDLVLRETGFGSSGGRPAAGPSPGAGLGGAGLAGVGPSVVAPAGEGPTVTNSVSVQIRVTVPLDTLRGVSDEPGDLAGYGPITAEQAREVAADPRSVWRRLVTDPLSGALLDYGTTRYRPPPHLADHVVSRHQCCQFPGCRTPAHRCDLDHNVPFDPEADEGPTSAANLGPKCRPHHRLKGMPGWQVLQYPDGSIVWTTPSGHTYRVDPPPLTERRPGRAAVHASAVVTDDDPPPF